MTRPHKKHRYTAAEDARLRREYRRTPTAELAAELGVSRSALHQHAAQIGIAQPGRRIGRRKELERLLRARHKLGWSDVEIAEAWTRRHPEHAIDRRTVCDIRRGLGLAHNAYSVHRRRQVAARTRAQCRAAGVRSLAEVRSLAFRKFARGHGWPEDLRPRHVQILELLYEHGPHTRRQIAEALKMPWKGSRKSLVSNDPEGSYLAHLIRRSLVVTLGRIVKGQGRGKSVNQYAIPLHVRRKTSP